MFKFLLSVFVAAGICFFAATGAVCFGASVDGVVEVIVGAQATGVADAEVVAVAAEEVDVAVAVEEVDVAVAVEEEVVEATASEEAEETEESTSIKVQQGMQKTDVLIFPNPTSGFVTVRINYETKNASIQLFNQSGYCLLNKKLYGSSDNLLDVRILEAGVYMYRVFENYKKIDVGKLIISK